MTTISFELWGSHGHYNYEVVGETFHERQLRAIMPAGSLATGIEFETTAELLPEPKNRHDSHAVAVVIDRQTVGYLAKEDAFRYQPVLLDLVRSGHAPTVSCRVWAREDSYTTWDDRGREHVEVALRSRVSVALAEPHLLVPLNLKPSAKHVLLPVGAAVQVTGEEARMEAIAPWLRPQGEGWVHATLHPLIVQSSRAERTVVEVWIDDDPVGVLTPRMSGEFLPAVAHLQGVGLMTCVRALVKGNRLKAEIVLYCQRAHELPPAWIDLVSEASTGVSAAQLAVDKAPPVVVETATKPTSPAWVFNPPPTWPVPPVGWRPPEGWRPPPDWPVPPPDWQFWIYTAVTG